MITISISLEIPQSFVRDGSHVRENDSIHIPIDFKIRNIDNQ